MKARTTYPIINDVVYCTKARLANADTDNVYFNSVEHLGSNTITLVLVNIHSCHILYIDAGWSEDNAYTFLGQNVTFTN